MPDNSRIDKKHVFFISGCLALTGTTSLMPVQGQELLVRNQRLGGEPGIASVQVSAQPAFKRTTLYVKASVMRSFILLFDKVNHIKWAYNNNGYATIFKQEDGNCRAFFDNKGRIFYFIRYGGENGLPREVRVLIKATYMDYTIGIISEMDTQGSKVWIINLEDKDNLIMASLRDGVLNGMQYFKTHFKTSKKANTRQVKNINTAFRRRLYLCQLTRTKYHIF